MKFIIDRSKWRSGGICKNAKSPIGKGEVFMLNKEGYMCCLGQICDQLGVPNDIQINNLVPESIIKKLKIQKLIRLDLINKIEEILPNDFASTAISINDNNTLTTTNREKELKKLFQENGHEIKFIGKSIKHKL